MLGRVTYIFKIDEAVLCRSKYNRVGDLREQRVLGMQYVTLNEILGLLYPITIQVQYSI